MCYGGHIVLDDYRVFTLVDGAVLEIKNGHIFKQIAKNTKVKVVGVPKELSIKVTSDNFHKLTDPRIKVRYTSATKAMGQNHLDLPEDTQDEALRHSEAKRVIARVAKEGDNRDQFNSCGQKLMVAFKEVGALEVVERIEFGISSGEITSVKGMERYVSNLKTMKEELGIVGGYSKNQSILERIGSEPGKSPKVPLLCKTEQVEAHAVMRFFERIVPRLEKHHIEEAREFHSQEGNKNKDRVLGKLKSSLAESGITPTSYQEAQRYLASLVTDQVGSSLDAKDRFTFSHRNTSSSKDNRFILKVKLPLGETMEIVCELLKKHPGSASYEVKIVSLWDGDTSSGYMSEKNHSYNQIDESSIWYFDGLAKNLQYDLARATEKILVKALVGS